MYIAGRMSNAVEFRVRYIARPLYNSRGCFDIINANCETRRYVRQMNANNAGGTGGILATMCDVRNVL